ncbi:hypothetical protein GL50803_0010778 [Giardia duodenalis]|uniref:Uncharacterized protein n=1 Tax=Giardia intestinalis (strain ATCC 50803 / WB clone C6) TaxID=184922 RepID=A8BJK2_GIAIC|nr:hypothetical protein GL50803_0010778 [Giardia intestinalis]KAE8303912.1 hypothetical protein GL50803_0010778 [Giardia intestinalis]|eukprot:XP_001706600.1 Hypothetical protein GL50803_10778 [Giardia lamblia ATCC 50803]
MSLTIALEESRQATANVGAPIYATASIEGLYPPPDYDFVYQFSTAEASDAPTYRVVQPYSIDRRCIFFSLALGQLLLKCEVRLAPRRLTTPLDLETSLSQPHMQMILRKPTLLLNAQAGETSPFTKYLENPILSSSISINVKTVGTQVPPCMVPLPNTISPIYVVPEHQVQPMAKVRIIIKPHIPVLAANAEQKREAKNNNLFITPSMVPPPDLFSEAGFFTEAVARDGTKKKGLFSGSKKDKDELEISCNLCKGYIPPVKDLVLTEWQDVPPGKPYFIPLFGILPNKLYEFRHQVLDPVADRRFELKEPIIFQAETIGMKSWLVPYQFTPLFASDQNERNFFVSTSGVAAFKEFVAISGEKTASDLFLKINSSGVSEAAMYTPYGQMMIFIHNSVQQGAKIIHCHKDAVMTISAGLCDWLHNGNFEAHVETQDDDEFGAQSGVQPLETSVPAPSSDTKEKGREERKIKKLTPKGIGELVCKSLQISSGTDSIYMNQYIYSSAINGSPMRMFSLGYINSSLMRKALASLDSGQEPIPYRPMVAATYVELLENREIILAGLAEVPFTRTNYPVLFEKVSQQINHLLGNMKAYSGSDQKNSRKVLGVDSSLLTAAVFHLDMSGHVTETFYACDMFPDVMNMVQFTELAWNRNEKGCLIPGYYTQSKFTLIHSYVSSVDCTQTDCLLVLPRQSSLVKLTYGSFKSTQPRSRAVPPTIPLTPQPSLATAQPSTQPSPQQAPPAYAPAAGPYASMQSNAYNTSYNAVGNIYSMPSSNPYMSAPASSFPSQTLVQNYPTAPTVPSQLHTQAPAQGHAPPNPYAIASAPQPLPPAANPYLVANPYLKPTTQPKNIDGDAPALLTGLDALKGGAQDSVILSANIGTSTCSDYLINILGVCYPLAASRISGSIYMVCNTPSAIELIAFSTPYFVGRGPKTHAELLNDSTGGTATIERYDTSLQEAEAVTVQHKIVLQRGKATVARILTLPQGGCVVAWMEDGQNIWKVMEINNGLLMFAGKIANAEDISLLPTF